MLSNLGHSIQRAFRAIFYDGYTPPIPKNNSPTAVATDLGDAPRYPPIDQGIELTTVQSVLQSQRDLIDRIQRTAGLPGHDFNERFMPVIENVARYVHLLPATRTGHHRGAGGLFRLSLEMGLYCLQIANSTIFANKGGASAETTYRLHPRWVYAAFLTGICSELYRPITNMVVTTEDGEKWPQMLTPLHDWASSKKARRYHVVWNIQDEIEVIAQHRSSSAYVLNVIAPMSGLQYLNDGSSEIVTAMTGCITNSIPMGVRNQIRDIVDLVRKKVVERDLKRNSERYGDFSVGAHLEPHLIDAMRKLIRKKTWEINVKGARIWHSSEGMFIVWQPAAREIIGVMKEENLPGIPNEADTLADILITSGIAERNDADGRYWDICIPISMQVLPSLKIDRIEVLFNDETDLVEFDGALLPENLEVVEKKNAPRAKADAVPVPAALPAAAALSKPEFAAPKAPMPLQNAVEAQTVVPDAPCVPGQSQEAEQGTLFEPAAESSAVQSVAFDVSTPAAPKPKKTSTTAKAIQKPAPQQTDEEADLAARMFKTLPNEATDYLRAIIEDQRDGSSAGPVFSIQHGVAVSVQELESHGQTNFIGLVKALYDKSWLWVDPEKPTGRLHDLPYGGKSVKAIVIRKDIARSLGFEWKQPKK